MHNFPLKPASGQVKMFLRCCHWGNGDSKLRQELRGQRLLSVPQEPTCLLCAEWDQAHLSSPTRGGIFWIDSRLYRLLAPPILWGKECPCCSLQIYLGAPATLHGPSCLLALTHSSESGRWYHIAEQGCSRGDQLLTIFMSAVPSSMLPMLGAPPMVAQ